MQCFIVNSEEIKDRRIDPYYYNLEFQSVIKKLFLNKNICKIGDLILSWSRGDGPREGFYTDDKANGVFFLRVNNLKNHSIDLKDVKYINKNIHETKLKRAQVKGGDLVFAISGTKDNLGTVSIIPEEIKEANLNSALVKIDLDKTRIKNEYFCLFFDSQIARSQIDFIGNGAAQNNLNNEEISQILIPVPPIETQEKIIALMDRAQASKKAMEDEAERLLSGIGDYVLNELGIELPKIEQKKCFVVMSDDINNERLDPIYSIEKNLSYNSVKFESKTINQLLYQGFVIAKKGESITKQLITDGNIPVIAGGQSVPYYHYQSNFSNAITISASGAYAGYVWYHNYPFWASDCTVIYSLNEKQISTEYLYYFLKSQQKAIYKRQRGAGQPHVYLKDLEDFIIPLPSIEIQNKIITEARTRIQKAERLKEEAKSLLQTAKDEVEKMILGVD